MQAIRAALVTHASPIFWLGLAGLSGYLVVRIVQRRVLTRVQMAMAFLISCIATQIPIAVLGEGFFGLALHLNCARLCIDLLLAILTYQLFHAVVLRNFSGRRFHRGAETAVGE